MESQLPKLIPGQDIDLEPGERINIVKNKINGEMFYSSNRYEQEIGGEKFIGIFKKPVNKQVRINWMRRDHLIHVAKGTGQYDKSTKHYR